MAGYIGSKASVTQVDGYNRSEADDEFVQVTGDTMTGALTVGGNFSVDGGTIKLDGNYPVGTNNVALGDTALSSVTSADSMVALGFQAALSNTSGSANTAVGRGSLYSNTTGNSNTGIGYNALVNNTTASNNTAVGYQALYTNSVGESNVAIGLRSLLNNTTSNNTAVGYEALELNTTGTANAAVGLQALENNTTGSNNVALGFRALEANTTASENTAVGYLAGFSNTTGTHNTFLGRSAGESATTGTYNTFVGISSGEAITTGAKNTILGKYTGNQGGLDIRTSSNNIVLSDGDGNPRIVVRNDGKVGIGTGSPGLYLAGVFGQVIYGTAAGQSYHNTTNNQTWLTFVGNVDAWYEWYNVSSSRTEAYITTGGAMYNRSGTYGTISDVRYKQDIVDSGSQWDDIKALQFKKYRMIDDVNADPENAPVMLGVIAQDLEAAGMNGLVEEAAHKTTDEDGNIVDTGETRKTVKYSILYMKAVKALQEAMDRIETLEAKVTALEAN